MKNEHEQTELLRLAFIRFALTQSLDTVVEQYNFLQDEVTAVHLRKDGKSAKYALDLQPKSGGRIFAEESDLRIRLIATISTASREKLSAAAKIGL